MTEPETIASEPPQWVEAIAKTPSQPSRRVRQRDTTREAILHQAARIFSKHGFEATTMREIAGAIGVAAGSIYHHFGSKDQIFAEVYKAGLEHLARALRDTIEKTDDPWMRLEKACALHIDALVNGSPYAAVLSRDMPRASKPLLKTLVACRDEYEHLFKSLFDDLDIADDQRRQLLRLQLLGALNWTLRWYRKGGAYTPAEIARVFIGNLRRE